MVSMLPEQTLIPGIPFHLSEQARV